MKENITYVMGDFVYSTWYLPDGLVSLFNLCRLFNAKAILLEEQ